MYPGSKELLEFLTQKNIPFALVRNTTLPPQEFQNTLEKAGASKYFRVDKNVVLSGDVGRFSHFKKFS